MLIWNHQKIDVTITFPVEITPIEGVELSRIGEMLGYHLNDNDYRRPFDVEMLTYAFRLCLQAAIKSAVDEREQNRYPNELILHYDEHGRENGCTSKWVITAEEAIKQVSFFPECRQKVKIESSLFVLDKDV